MRPFAVSTAATCYDCCVVAVLQTSWQARGTSSAWSLSSSTPPSPNSPASNLPPSPSVRRPLAVSLFVWCCSVDVSRRLFAHAYRYQLPWLKSLHPLIVSVCRRQQRSPWSLGYTCHVRPTFISSERHSNRRRLKPDKYPDSTLGSTQQSSAHIRQAFVHRRNPFQHEVWFLRQ